MVKKLTSLGVTPLSERVSIGAADGIDALGDSPSLTALKARTGVIDSFKARREESRAAGAALQNLRVEQVRAQGRVALTSIALAEQKVRAALVTAAMPQIGALTVTLNSATAAVDQALSNTSVAMTLSAINARTQGRQAVEGMHQAGNLSADEATALRDLVDSDCAEDVQRARARVAAAKVTVDTLHGHAIGALKSVRQGGDQ